ncbi:LCP family protein [Thermopolyspora sp. NPDC052614]|uniref:LCP family protein n=1 Tax=Thermopolyspora sp. NPDC052614 TaxID=3155682 RepID=UPI003438B2AF
MSEWPGAENDRTRAIQRPGQAGQPQPGPQPPAWAISGRPTAAAPPRYDSPEDRRLNETTVRKVSRVYGRPRKGDSPVRPLRATGGGGGPSWPGGGSGSGTGGTRAPRRWGRIILGSVAVLVVLLLVAGVGLFLWVNSRIKGIEVLEDYEGRPAETPGQDWLLVGSDSRAGLSAAQRRKLATGRAAGKRTDTMMLLHIPDNGGRPTLVSLPRDSLVPIEGHGSDKLNAAYSFDDGGPKLLTRTVEKITGIRIDHYMEIGFGGFVGIVDAVGGVNICVKQNIRDPKAGINLKKGCQELDGGTALGYVRTRATGAIPDFERTQRQRQFFSAVVKKAASPGVLLNPFQAIPLAAAATDSVSVDNGTGTFDLLSLGLAMSNDPVTTVVPVGSFPTINGVNYAKWDSAKATKLFDALAADKQVPKDALAK